jgi:hypothetical protein
MVPENREPLGSKRKLWLRDVAGEKPRLLFKYNRPGTGEDWSEKIAAELARLLGVPHAEAELATFDGQAGAALVDFTDNEQLSLVHGNELLEFVDRAYPAQQKYGAVGHTPAAVVNLLGHLRVTTATATPPPSGVEDAFGVFVGYLLLDAWIGNTDRHHENWGVLWRRREPLLLAPSFDHASSLGRELTDAARTNVGDPRHGTTIERYARRARSALYASDGSGKQLSTLEAFREAAAFRPKAAQGWVDRLLALDPQMAKTVVGSVPDERMSRVAKAFACALLECNAKLVAAR